MASYCPNLSGNNVTSLIDNQLSQLMGYGQNAYNTAMSSLRDIEQTFLNRFSTADALAFPPDTTDALDEYLNLPEFQMPTKPSIEDLVIALPDAVSPPPAFSNVVVNFPSPPTEPTQVIPTYVLPTRPGALQAVRPESPAEVTLPTYPSAPVLTWPEVPSLESLHLPSPPDLDVDAIVAEFIALLAQRPEAPNITLTDDFLTTLDQQYALTTERAQAFVAQCPALANLCPRLNELLAGDNLGLPPGVETALRDRAVITEDKLAFQAERAAIEDWQGRGFTLPAGVLDSKILLIRQQAWDKKSAASRDIWLESAKLAIESLRFAIQQGIALEGQYWDKFLKIYDLCRNIAASLFDVQSKIVTTQLDLFKSELTAWQTYSELFKTWLQAELSKLDVYKSELDAQRLLGEINQQDVALYKSRLDAVMSMVSVYKIDMDAANSRLQGEMAKIDLHKTQMQAYAADVGAYEVEWKAYGQAIQGELGKTEIYKAISQAHAIRLDGYKSAVGAEQAKGSFEIESQKMQLSLWNQQAEYYKTQLGAEMSRIEAVLKMASTKAGIFGAEIQGESARIGVEEKEADLRLRKKQIVMQQMIEEARLEMTKVLETSKTSLQAMGDIGRVSSQLAAGTLSALNMSASIGSSSSWDMKSGCSVDYNIDVSE